jgi:hypothetical protein
MREGLSPRISILVLVLGVVAFGLPMFAELKGIASADEFRNNDWLNCRSFDVLSRRAILQDGEFPLRTHLLGGGFPIAAHPSDGSWAPTILAVLLFGDVVGVKVNLLLLFFAGAVGAWGLSRRFLGLSPPASLFAGLLFAFSGWAPSMLLVGFYHQVFYLLAPGILYLLLTSPRRPARLLVAGLLLCFVLQQGGHAFPAIVYLLALCCWLLAADEAAGDDAGPLSRWGPPLGLLLLLSAPLAFAREMNSAWPLAVGWVPALALLAGLPRMRRMLRTLLPWAGRIALVLVVACSLGAPRLAGLLMLDEDGEYSHDLNRRHADWFPDLQAPSDLDYEVFYEGPVDFVRGLSGRVAEQADYRTEWGRKTGPIQREYAYLGLTPYALVLALIGVVVGLRDRRSALLAVAAILFSLISFGWNTPADFHFLLTWGLPYLQDFAQPIKYYNFFILLSLVCLAAVALQRLLERVPEGLPRRGAMVVAFALLLLPFLQNRAPLGELFAEPRPAPEEEPHRQVAMVGDPSWMVNDAETIREMGLSAHLRGGVRPTEATEYHNIRRGVGTIDWYGSLVLGEAAWPASYLTLAGDVLPNPAYAGSEAWAEGPAEIEGLRLRHNSAEVDVGVRGDGALLVINQSWLEGFETSEGELVNVDGLLGVVLEGQGSRTVRLVYRPRLLLMAFAVAGVSLLLWLAALVVLLRRGRAARAAG